MTAFLLAFVVAVAGGIAMMVRRGPGGTRMVPGGASRTKGSRVKSVTMLGAGALLATLAELPEGFRVFTFIRTAAGEVPAAVVGPTGLWALGATDLAGPIGVIDGAVTVSGRATDLASTLWRRAHALADEMAPWLDGEAPVVQGGLVFVAPSAVLAKSEAMGVRLFVSDDLVETITQARVRLDPEGMTDVATALAATAGTDL